MAFPKYKDLTKKQEDLFKEHFCFANIVGIKLKNKTADHYTYNLKLNQPGLTASSTKVGDISGEMSVKYEKDDLSVEGKTKTNRDVSCDIGYKPRDYVKNFKLTFMDVANSAAGKRDVNFGFEHAAENGCNVKAEYKHSLTKEDTLQASMVGGKDGIALGFDGEYNFTTKRFMSYNGMVWFNRNNQVLAFKHVSNNKSEYKMGDLVASYFQTLSNGALVGGEVKHNWDKHENSFTVGTQVKLDDDTTVKAKLGSNNKLATALRQKFSKNVTLNFSTEIDTNQLHSKTGKSDFNYGVLFEFTY